ncbi:armadillo-type protein [Sparassis latifolia]
MLATAEHPVHNIAKVSFGTGMNELYDRARPSYQPATLSHIHNALSASAPLNTVEIGAGTGIFTRALLAHPDWSHSVNQLHAIELSEGMRDVFANFVHDPRVSVTEGTFDSTGVNDGWADHVIIAQLMDQIIATALPESTDPNDVSVTEKAFLMADLPIELIELLEKLILEPSPFSDNRNLQNLMVLTAIRADKGKVVRYIDKLKNYDIAEIAKIVTDHGLYEEAFLIYKKYEQHAMAINVLIEHIVFLDRGTEYAIKVNRPKVWSRLVKAQLDSLRIKDAIDDLAKYLQMVRKTLREPKIDMELAYAYGKTDRLHDMKDFLTMTNVADILEVGEKCFEDELYQAAKLLFTSISNWARLITMVIYLSENQAAMGIFTELSAFYGKYRPEKFMEHLKLFVSRINIPKVIKSAEQAHLWPELDNVALAMIERSADAWEHNQFEDVIIRVANIEIYHKSLMFYLQEQPTLLTNLLTI